MIPWLLMSYVSPRAAVHKHAVGTRPPLVFATVIPKVDPQSNPPNAGWLVEERWSGGALRATAAGLPGRPGERQPASHPRRTHKRSYLCRGRSRDVWRGIR